MVQELTDAVVALASSAWVLVVVFGLVVGDGVFPPIPSEASVLALASLSRQPGTVGIGWIMAAAGAGAFVGDLLAFGIGRLVPLERLPLVRSPRGVRAVAWADQALQRRGTAFLLAARYIPIGRVVANLTAGALGFPLRRFVPIAGIGAVGWALWMTGLGLGAGQVFVDRPLIGALVGALAGLVIGTALDRLLGARFGRPLPSGEPD